MTGRSPWRRWAPWCSVSLVSGPVVLGLLSGDWYVGLTAFFLLVIHEFLTTQSVHEADR